jgi:hypothetical protein
MFIATFAVKGDEVIIIQGLDPVRVLVSKIYGLKDGNQNIHISLYLGISSVAPWYYEYLTYIPNILPIISRISSSQNSYGSE